MTGTPPRDRSRDRPGVRTALRPVLPHPDKPLWPEPAGVSGSGLTKRDFAAYLVAVAPAVLPHLRNRPLVLTRYPHGAGGPWFYQKNLPPGAPAWIETFTYRGRGGRAIRYVLCQDERALVWLAGQAAIEFHPWLSTTADPERPDRLVVDLDPMPPATFTDARPLAAAVREILDRASLRSYPKTSGATGIHIFVPIAPRYPFRSIQALVRSIGLWLQRAWPERVTLERTVSRRGGRVYVDYLQNAQGKTLIAPYAPRPLPGAPVSTPFAWDELTSARPAAWTLRSVPARVRARGDPFSGILDGEQDLEPLAELLGVARSWR